MLVTPTIIPDVKILEPRVFGDARGFFMETWNSCTFAAAGLELVFVQDNHSHSAKNVLRGLHYQLRHPQGKLVRVTAGRVFDVAVDLRRSSPSFGKWVGAELSADNKRMLWIPPGFAHGFLTLEADTDFLYKCTDFYDPEDEQCIMWNDPDLGIDWPFEAELTVSNKDSCGRQFSEAETYA